MATEFQSSRPVFPTLQGNGRLRGILGSAGARGRRPWGERAARAAVRSVPWAVSGLWHERAAVSSLVQGVNYSHVKKSVGIGRKMVFIPEKPDFACETR